MIRSSTLPFPPVFPLALLFSAQILSAAPIDKADNLDNLNLSTSWLGGVAPGVNDVALWGSGVTTPGILSLGADLSWQGISVTSPANLVEIGSGNVLTIGVGGINMSTATQDLTVHSGLTLGAGSQTWNIATGRTLTLDTGTFTRTAGSTLNLQGGGTVLTSNITNDATGIVGTWASTGTGAATRYATVSGGTLTSYTGTAAATAANVTDTTGTLNYDVAAVAVLGTGANVNTLRYTGAAGTISGTLTANGLMNAGSGTVTYGNNVTIGNNKELVVNAANAGVTISGAVLNNGGGASSLVKTGSGTLILSSNSNTFSNGLNILSGTAATDALSSNTTTINRLGTGVVNVASGATLNLNIGANSGNTITYGIAGLTGAGTVNVTLSNSTSSSGGIVFNGSVAGFTGTMNVGTGSGSGKLQLNSTSGVPSSSSVMNVLSGGTLYLNSRTLSNTLTLNGGDIGEAFGQLRLDSSVFTGNLILAGNMAANDSTIGGFSGTGLISGNISESGGARALSKAGTTTITLSGTNTYTGGTTVSAGVLQAAKTSSLPDYGTPGKISVSNGAYLAVNVGGPGEFTTADLDTIRANANFNAASHLGIDTTNAPGTVIYGSNVGDTTNVAGALGLMKLGTGTLQLTGNNTYSSFTTLNAGTLELLDNPNGRGGLGTGAVVFNGSSTLKVSTTGPLTLSNGANFNTSAAASFISGSNLTFNGQAVNTTGGNPTLSVNNNTTFAGGLALSNSSTARTITFNGTGTVNLQGNVINSTSTATLSGLTYSGSGTINLNGTNSYTGTTTLSSGTMNLNSASALGPGTLQINGGTFNNNTGSALTLSNAAGIGGNCTLSGSGLTVNGLTTNTAGGNVTITVSNGTTTLAGGLALSNSSTARTVTFGGAGTVNIPGNIINSTSTATGSTLTISGTGTVNLSGTSSYTGATTLTSGTLAVNSAGAIGSGILQVNGGTLTNTSGAPVTIANNFGINGNVNFGQVGGNSNQNLTATGTAAFAADINRTISLFGTGTTLTIGSTWNNNNANNRILTVNGTGNTFAIAGIGISDLATNRTLTIAGTANTTVTGVIANGGTAPAGNLTVTSSGTVTLLGANTYNGLTNMNSSTGTLVLAGDNVGTGGVTVTTGKVCVNSAGTGTSSALGTGTLTLAGGTIDTTTGSALTVSTNNPIAWTGNFTFGGTNNLNLGTGAITNGGSRTVTLNGSGTTLTMGGLMTNTSVTNQTTTVNGAGNTLVLGNYNINNNAGSATNIAGTFNGTGNVVINGVISDNGGLSTGGVTYSGSGNLTLNATNTFTGPLNAGGTGVLSIGSIGNAGTPSAAGAGLTGTNSLIFSGGTLKYTGATDATTDRTGSVVGNTNINANSTLDLAGGGNLTFTNKVEGSAITNILTKKGAGILILTGTADNRNFTLSVTEGTAYLDKVSASAVHAVSAISNVSAGATVVLTGSGTDQIYDGSASTAGIGRVNSIATSGLNGTLDLNGRSEQLSALNGSATTGLVTNTAAATSSTLTFGNIDVASTYNGTFQNGAGGTGVVNLSKIGTGTFDLNGDISAGTITQSAGTLNINGKIVSAGAITMSSGTMAINGDIQSSGLITTSGGTSLTLAGNNSNTSGIMITGGTLIASANANLGAASNPITFNGGQFKVNGTSLSNFGGRPVTFTATKGVSLNVADPTHTFTVSETLNQTTGGLTKGGTGTLAITSTTTYTGATTINAGTLDLSSTGDLVLRNATGINGSGGTITSSGGGRILINTSNTDIGVSNGGTLTVNAIIANGTSTAVDFWHTSGGTGVVVLNGANTVSTVNVQADVVSVSNIGNSGVAGNLGMGTVTLASSSSATLRYTGTGETTNRGISLASVTQTPTLDMSGTGTLKFTGNFASTGAGTKTFVLTGSTSGIGEIGGIISNNSGTNLTSITKNGTGTWVLSGSNTYTGGTNINGGTLVAGSAGALGASGTISFGGGILQLTPSNTVDYSARFSTAANQSYSLNTNGQNATWSTNLTSTGGTLSKAGAGKLTLTGTSTYTGATTISGGTLAVNGSLANTSSVNVNNGGTLGGSGSIAGPTSINSGGTLAPGNSPGVDTFSAGLTLNAGSNYSWELAGNVSTDTTGVRGTDFDGTNVSGGILTIQTGVTANLVFNSAGSSVDWSNSFWSTDHQWMLFSNSNTPTTDSGSIFDLVNVSPDAQGDLLSAGASFTLTEAGNNILLAYTAVPEPSAGLLLLLAGPLLLLRRRGRGSE